MANFLIIRDLCKQKKITIRELANRVGIGESALQSLIKNGSTNTLTLEKIAKELDVNAGVFFGETQSAILNNVNSPNSALLNGNGTITTENANYQEIIKKMQEQIDSLIEIINKSK